MTKLNFTNVLCRKGGGLPVIPKFLCLLLTVSILSLPLLTKAQYCTSLPGTTYGVCTGGAIFNVKFNTLNHSAGCVISTSTADYYKNLTSSVSPTSVTPGMTYPISVTHSETWAGGAAIWIDFNGNQIFETTERILFSTSTSVANVLSGNVKIPMTAKAGATRMRVIASEGDASPSDPCSPGSYAEIEDYTINILPKPLNNASVTDRKEVSSFCAGPGVSQDVFVRVANLGSNQISSLTINWQVDGVPQSPVTFGSLIDTLGGANPTDTLLLLGSVPFPTSIARNIKAWTSLPNGVADITSGDDTLSFTIRPMMNGSYTIGLGGDFNSFTGAVTALQNGICGPVTLDFLGSTNVFEEQVTILAIPGASATSPVIINGNGNTLTFGNNSFSAKHILKLQGTKHITVNNLILKGTNTSYGWGIHINGSDSNTINGCKVYIDAISSPDASNSAGIVINNSNTNPITGGANFGNVISNNIIKGAAGAGLYYGIVVAPSTSSATATYTKVLSNTIEDFYAYGIYATHINNAVIKGNIIRNVLKTSNNTTVWGIALESGARSSTITENQISSPFGTATTSTGTFIGILSTSTTANTPAGSENLIANNIIYKATGAGTFTGISLDPAPNTLVYHNTINFDNTSSTATTITRGIYQSGTATGIQLLNNVISITRGGTGLKHLLYFNTANTIVSNNNGLYISTASNNHVGYSVSSNYTSLTDWSTAKSFDTASVFDNPLFVYATAANLEPQTALYDNIGANLSTVVPVDIRQNTRSAFADPGAFEYTPTGCLAPSNLTVASVTSSGAQVSWTAPSVAPGTGYEYYIDSLATSPVNSGTTETSTSATVSGLLPSTTYYLFVRSICPTPGVWAGPVAFTTLCAPLPGGTYTLGGPGADFGSFTQLANRLNCGSGISGPVVVNVTPGSAPFTEQFALGTILNTGPVNTITINGNGNTLQANASSAQRSIIRFQGTSYVTIDNLTIKTLNATYGWGVHIYQASTNNVIQNCTIDLSAVTSTDANSSAGIVFSNSLTTATTTGANGSLNTIQDNLILGNPTGAGMYYGIALSPSTNVTLFSGNQLLRNTIRNFYFAGIYAAGTNGSTIKGNIIENPSKTSLSSSVYGISMNTGYRGDLISENEIRNLTGGSPSASATLYGISFSNTTSNNNTTPVGTEMNVTNNTIYNLKSSGNIYGIYASNATNIRYYHNTIILNDSNASSSFTRGFYHTGTLSGGGLAFKNNIVVVNRNTTGANHAVYLSTNSQLYAVNNNAYWVSGSNASVGSFVEVNYAALTNWTNATGFDAHSRITYPEFVDVNNGNVVPDAGLMNNIGADLTALVPVDKSGATRSTTPDPGAYEFTPSINTDAGIAEIIMPKALPTGSVSPEVTIFNAGALDLSNVTINWEVNGVVQITAFSAATIPSGGISAPIALPGYTFAEGITYTIKAWTSSPNFSTDEKPSNDTLVLGNLVTAIPGGNYTIYSGQPTSGSNFNTFADFIQKAESVGVSGPIDIQIIDTLLTGRIIFGKEINGTSALNTITFRSSDTSHTTLTSTTNNTLTLMGPDHLVFRDLTIINTNASTAAVIWLSNSADSNSFIHCTITSPVHLSGSSAINVFASADLTYKAEGNNAKGTLIDSCYIKGGNESVAFIGASYPALPENVIDPRVNSHNQVAHSVLDSMYATGIYTQLQSHFIADGNDIRHLGNNVNTFPAGIYLNGNIYEGSVINANTIVDVIGGQGIFGLSDLSNNTIISNNMLQLGTGANVAMAIRWIGTSATIVYNSVNITCLDMNGTALFIAPSGGTGTFNVYNNIFKNATPGQLVNYNSAVGTNYNINNNVYYGTGPFPYRYNNSNYATLPELRTAMAIGSDLSTLTIDPLFVSTSNLRTYNPVLNAKGFPLSFIDTDIDGNLRDKTTPDVGVNEISLPSVEDAGVIAITSPSIPLVPGSTTPVKVVIQNHGVGTLTSAYVNYSFNSVVQNILYTGNLAEGETDTVVITTGFTIPTTGGFTLSAWTDQPNFATDHDKSNDTTTVTYCQPMSGTYTIDPSGSAPNNFVSFSEALSTLICAGVNDAVTFNVASGVYTEQLEFPNIAGTSPQHPVTFRAASGNKSDVELKYASTNDTNNYVVKFTGANNIAFTDMTLTNTGTSHARVFVLNVVAARANDNITIRNNEISGATVTTNSNTTALVFATDHNTNISIINNVFNNGSAAVSISGNPVVTAYSQNLTIDSNKFNNFAYSGIATSYRSGLSINGNTITSNRTTATDGILAASTAGGVSITGNKINTLQGNGIRLISNAYYDEPGRALVANNAVLLSGTGSVNQSGIKVQGGSKVDVYNNTVKINSATTTPSASALHIEGDIRYTNLANTTSYDFRILNNILHAENGYPLNIAEFPFTPTNLVSKNAVYQINNNIYHTVTGANVARVVTDDYDKTNFNGFKNAILTGSDIASKYVRIVFENSNSVKPLTTDTSVWYVNGRALHIATLTSDVEGNQRSAVPYTGVPDMGAFEITPAVPAPLAVATPALPAQGITQLFTFYGDTVATIHWDAVAPVPASVQVRQFVGEAPPATNIGDHRMYVYTTLTMPASTSLTYQYNFDMKYKSAWVGSVPFESNLAMAIKMPGLGWTGTPSTIDTVNKHIVGSNFIENEYIITGTNLSNTLPVKLVSFNAYLENKGVNVTWKSASENNVSHYAIERSVDGMNFTTISKAKALNKPAAYQYFDNLLGIAKVKTVYYRLKAVDADGSFSYSTVAVVNLSATGENSVVVAPNPVDNLINLQFMTEAASAVQVSIFDMRGQLLSDLHFDIGQKISIPASDLTHGLYLLKVSFDGKEETIRFLKNH